MVLVVMLKKLRTTIIFSFLFLPQISFSLDYNYSVYLDYKNNIETYFVIINLGDSKDVKYKNVILFAKKELINFIKLNNNKVSYVKFKGFNLYKIRRDVSQDYFIFSVSKDNVLIN